MYLRLRKLDAKDLKEGDVSIVVAVEGTVKGSIHMQPAQLEWWDGIEWHKVQVVNKDADNRSPYA